MIADREEFIKVIKTRMFAFNVSQSILDLTFFVFPTTNHIQKARAY